jgi:hypothetical protein
MSPSTSSGLPGPCSGAGRASAPIWPCTGWGLPGRRVATTPVRSYRTISTLPVRRLPKQSSPSAVCFLLHFPSGHPALPLASIPPCGVRTFLSDAPRTQLRPRPIRRLAIQEELRNASQRPFGPLQSRSCRCASLRIKVFQIKEPRLLMATLKISRRYDNMRSLSATSRNNDRITTGVTGKHGGNKQPIEQNKKNELTACVN